MRERFVTLHDVGENVDPIKNEKGWGLPTPTLLPGRSPESYLGNSVGAVTCSSPRH